MKILTDIVTVECKECGEDFERARRNYHKHKDTCYWCRDYGWKKGNYDKDYQRIAWAIMRFHIRTGRLIHLKSDGSAGVPCVDCGDPATGYDHRDYRKPLEVDPVCNPCNRRRGVALPYKEWNWRRT